MSDSGSADTAKAVTTELPAVAKSVFLECKKCGVERYHTVLAHTSATSAKVKCESCGATKTHKFIVTAKKAKSAATKAAVARANKANDHRVEYEKLLSQFDSHSATKYDMKLTFEANQKLNHPKFGVGFIRTCFSDKIEVVFQDEVRNLVHNRQ